MHQLPDVVRLNLTKANALALYEYMVDERPARERLLEPRLAPVDVITQLHCALYAQQRPRNLL
jgi:hypothetical protein